MTTRRTLLEAPDWKTAVKAAGAAPADVAVRKGYVADIRAVEDTPRTLQFTISTGVVDRHRDTINPRGWELTNYRKNPVVLFAHDANSLPVGKSLREWIENEALRSVAQFPEREVYPLGDTVYQMLRAGYLNATSVGFLPLEWTFVEAEDRPLGVDFIKQELLEYSIVPVPANPEALIDARGKGIDLEPVKTWADRVLAEWGTHHPAVPRETVERVYRILGGERTIVHVPARDNGGAAADGTRADVPARDIGAPSRVVVTPGQEAPAAVQVGGTTTEACADVIDTSTKDGAVSHVTRAGVALARADGDPTCLVVTVPDTLDGRTALDIPEAYADAERLYVHHRGLELRVTLPAAGEAEAKAGRVLSKKNEERLRQAAALLQEVLAQVEAQDEDDDKADDEDDETGGEKGVRMARRTAPAKADDEDEDRADDEEDEDRADDDEDEEPGAARGHSAGVIVVAEDGRSTTLAPERFVEVLRDLVRDAVRTAAGRLD